MKDLSRLYDKLSPDERFRLFVQAGTRRDCQEMDRLNDTCPRKSYTCEDDAYTQRKLRFFDDALLHSHAVANTDLVAFMALVLLLIAEGDPARVARVDRIAEALEKLAIKRQSMIEGWNRFCRELGLEPDSVATLFGSDRDWLMRAIDQAITDVREVSIDPDEAQVTYWLETWRESWSRES